MGISKDLATDLFNIQTLTERDREALRTLVIDFYAAAYAGYRQNKGFNEAVEPLVCGQQGTPEAAVFLHAGRLPAPRAAFLNAVYGHGAELDDGNKKAMGHVGVTVIPAVFSLAEKLGSKQEEVLLALAAGYEAFIRLSSAAQPGLVRRGFHATGVAGTLACAAACARLYGLDAQGIEDAIALATTMTGGLLSYGDSRPAIKPLNPAKAAENGVFAAMLAAAGVRGPSEALEGPNGWFHAVTDHVEETMLCGGDHLLLHDCYFKLYPSCRHTHCGIEAAAELHDRIAPEEIEEVRVFIYPNAIKLAGQILFPRDADETKFSIHYTLACALLRGGYGIADMNPPDLSAPVVRLIKKIRLIPETEMEDREKGVRGARIEIRKTDGSVLGKTVLVPRGDPEKPLTRADIVEKLHRCAGELAEEAALDALVRKITSLGGDEPFRDPTPISC